jgi:hypothetical protein
MPANEPLNFEQPKNRLSDIADGERKKLIPKNDYIKTGNEYSSVNPDALADGDAKGRGTGGDLDVYNEAAGTLIDIVERKNEVKLNFYKSNSPYTTPSA